MFVNLTPHEIMVEVEVEDCPSEFRILPIPPNPQGPARVTAIEDVVGLADSGGYTVTVSRHTFGQVENLPEPQKGTIFIVSGMVRDALDGRPDVLAPDTGKTAVRNQKGQVEYVTRLRTK